MRKFVLSLFAAAVLLTALSAPSSSLAAQEQEFRAVWVATVQNLDFPSKSGLTADQLKKETDSILDTITELGYNAVILQVRPTADAFYKSDIFPWSGYLTGTQGTAPAGGFDPFAYWVEQAHQRGLQIHAWINPFRVTQGTAANKNHDLSKLAASNPARKNPGWTVAHTDGRVYFNPGIPEVRKLIIDGCVELVKRYDVDGIHFDDYFYPGTDFNDEATYKKYGSGFSNKADWRRDNVNKLIEETYKAVKAARSDAQFGVSPFAIWANKASNNLGSDTNGKQSYSQDYADTRKWVKNNWLDYIAPQIYWNIGFNVADYAKLVPWWADVVKDTNVKLYIGKGIYRVEDAKSDSVWYDAKEIARQAELNAKYPEVKGVIHYRYSTLLKSSAAKEVVSLVFETQAANAISSVPVAGEFKMPAPQLGRLKVGRPISQSFTTKEAAYYILGTCDPGKKLLVNGAEVKDISKEGYFGYYATLKIGANNFKFTQDGQTAVTVSITRKTDPITPATPMSTIGIVAGSVFPKSANEYRRPGETVTLNCTAPIGAAVKVTIGGKTYDMTPASKTSPGSGAYPTTYTYQYTFPTTAETGKLVTIGTPKYTMTYKNNSYSRDAGGALISITPNAPYYAAVTSNNAFVYPNNTTTGGPKAELIKDQKDYVTAVAGNGDWVRLASGGWVQRGDVTLTTESGALTSEASAPVYAVGAKLDTLSLKMNKLTATDITFEGKTLVYTVSNTAAA
ncbi:MAG: family 10 glycosylhydrolase, partial [Oscillospiraceae bacterium]|nr:family 10 glycosylhydrolase [Oscillospiraceae bacterium]